MLSNYILKTEDCNYKEKGEDEDKNEMSVTGGGEAFSKPIGKDKDEDEEYIRREKLNNIKETIQKILNNK